MTNQSNDRARYVLRACFEAITPLHVGSGQDRRLSAQEAKPPGNAKDHGVIPWSAEVMRANVGERRAPCLPGASLKGALQERAQRLLSTPMREALFGLAKGDTTEPGRCEFRTALSTVGVNVRVEARTAIDRVTRTVMPGSLFHVDAVCDGARFDVEIVLPLASKEEASAVLQLLQSCTAVDPLLVGAYTRAGWGRLRLCDAGVSVMKLTTEQLAQWLASDGDTGWIDHLQGVEPGTLCLISTPQTIARARPLAMDIQLCFDGPFACNDQQRDKNMVDRPNIMPKLRDGRVLLPGTSFLGALRSQAERIARTLGIETRQGRDATVARKGQPPADLCSLLFGCTGWQGLVGASDFLGRPQETEMTQEMLAICRVTGGGKDSAKFRLRGYESPQLGGQLLLARDRMKSLETKLSESLLGLLLLTLRDLQDGDVFFGLGRSKGWGHCRVPRLFAEARKFLGLTDDHVRNAVNSMINAADPVPSATNSPQLTPALDFRTSPTLASLRRTAGGPDSFHNPYQFLPFAAIPQAAQEDNAQPPTAGDLQQGRHSHDQYHAGTYSGELVGTLTTVTPTFVGAAQETDEDRRRRNATDQDPKNVTPFTYAGARAVPGTSLRGMLGQLIETMSGSNMRVLDADRPLSVRMSVQDGAVNRLPGKGMVVDENGELRVHNLNYPDRPPYAVQPEAAERLYALADSRKDDDDEDGKPFPTIKYVTGARRARNPDPAKFGERTARLMPGQIVFFRLNLQAVVEEIAWSQIWRRGMYGSNHQLLTLGDLVRHTNDRLLPLGQRQSRSLRPAELTLGVVEQPGRPAATAVFAFASKLSFSHALPPPAHAVRCMGELVLKELAAPKPPSPALYVRPAPAPATANPQTRYISKSDLATNPLAFTFNGTKVYLHAPRDPAGTPKHLDANGHSVEHDDTNGRPPWVSQKPPAPAQTERDQAGNFLSKRQVRVEPIESGEAFTFTIRFDNLSEIELCTLCAAIQPSEHFEHRLGMGKPLGLGSVKLNIQSLKAIDRSQRYRLAPEAAQAVPLDGLAFARQGMRVLRSTNPGLLSALLRYGEPRHVKLPVHYPQLAPGTMTHRERPAQNGKPAQPAKYSEGHLEKDSFEWWMANDRLREGKQFIDQ